MHKGSNGGSEVLRLLKRTLRLTVQECVLLAAAVAVVSVVRLGLWLLPFRTLRAALSHLPVFLHPATGVSSSLPQSVAWAVRRVSRFIPRATCLTQALSTQAILACAGIPVVLRIGVAPGQNGRLQAHAWVEYGDRVIIGWETHRSFIPFPPIEAVRP